MAYVSGGLVTRQSRALKEESHVIDGLSIPLAIRRHEFGEGRGALDFKKDFVVVCVDYF